MTTEKEAITERAQKAIAKGAYLEEGELDLDKTFADLGLESIDLLEIVFEIEEEFNIKLSLDDYQEFDSMTGHQLIDELMPLIKEGSTTTSSPDS